MISRSAASEWSALAARLSDLADSPREQLEAVLSAGLPTRLQAVFKPLKHARRERLDVLTPYAGEDEVNPYHSGLVIVARFGLTASATLEDDDDGDEASSDEDADLTSSGTPMTEDDKIGSLDQRDLDLETHSRDVECQAGAFARACGLSAAMTSDLALAGWLHDAGKADPRFQTLLGTGDPLFLEASAVLGKSGRRSAPGDWARAGLPDNWRHEALSVRLALANAKLGEAYDPALVVWLVGTHHGWGRPFFPHTDSRDDVGHPGLPTIEGLSQPMPKGPGPQSLGFSLDGELFAPRAGPDGQFTDDERGLDWVQIFDRLKRRYGVWGLAHLEAIVRLADHRASERRDAEGSEH
jgi:CRISPR-associated endonuclease/helicase Cas3